MEYLIHYTVSRDLAWFYITLEVLLVVTEQLRSAVIFPYVCLKSARIGFIDLNKYLLDVFRYTINFCTYFFAFDLCSVSFRLYVNCRTCQTLLSKQIKKYTFCISCILYSCVLTSWLHHGNVVLLMVETRDSTQHAGEPQWNFPKQLDKSWNTWQSRMVSDGIRVVVVGWGTTLRLRNQ